MSFRVVIRDRHVTSPTLRRAGLTELKRLNLNDTRITDAGLMHLKGMTELRILFLYDTQVTDAGIAELKQALPNCVIRY